MAEYLLTHQVKATDIVIDDQGNNTWLSAQNFKKSYPDSTSVVLVSQYFHISRCKLSFRKLGFTRISAVSPKYFEWRDFYALFREFFG
ncbi:YdcF family protein [Croceimicrobium sp.]|uniref:YdcF family protein n=1 Tax=Croceimicrobium sp. TaxID=2828340 RepID=UPI003BAD6809